MAFVFHVCGIVQAAAIFMIPHLVITKDRQKQDDYLEKQTSILGVPKHQVISVEPAEGSMGIDDIRSIMKHILTAAGGKRIIAIASFETATEEAQNALLKMLEDRSEGNLFILFSSSPERIIPTILSRTRKIVLDKDNTGLEAGRLEELEQLLEKVQSSEGYGFLISEQFIAGDKSKALRLIDDLILVYRNRLTAETSLQSATIIKQAYKIKNDISSLNCAPQLALDNLLLFIHKTASMKTGHEKK